MRPKKYVESAYCAVTIAAAVTADELVINGDYSLVSLIVIEREKRKLPTGFITMRKLNEPTSEKDADGNIIHRNILRPVGIRWTR